MSITGLIAAARRSVSAKNVPSQIWAAFEELNDEVMRLQERVAALESKEQKE
jgi:hypothetical protein